MSDLPTPSRERLVAYLDGELIASDARAVADWLASHPEARREAEEHRAVWRLLGAYRDEPVPEGFSRRVLDAAGLGDAAPEARPRASFALLSGGARSRVALAASILLAVGVGVVLGRRTAPPTGGAAPQPTASTAVEAIPADILASTDVETLASLSDDAFDILLESELEGDLDDLAEMTRGG